MVLLLCCGISQAANRALVIGNENYSGSPLSRLPGVKAVSEQFAADLRSLGFEVAQDKALSDLSLSASRDAIKGFVSSVSTGDVVIVYFAGHGEQFEGINYLLPVGADPSNSTSGIDLDAELLEPLIAKHPEATIVFVDACRASGPPTTDKLTQPQIPPSNAYVVFSAGPGQSAINNSGFRESLVEHIREPGEEISSIVAEVTEDVLSATHQTQRPQPYGALSPPIILRPPASVSLVADYVDDNLFVHVDDKLFCQWQDTSSGDFISRNTCTANNPVLLKKGAHAIRISIYNQQTYTGGIQGLGGHFPEGWHYHLIVSWAGQELVNVCDGEVTPKAHGPRHGKTFDTATFTLFVDPHTGAVTLADLVPRVWVGGGAPHVPCR